MPPSPDEGRLPGPAAPNPLLSVVMVTYGGDQWIPRSLDALAANTHVAYEVIIVDNASPGSTRDLLGRLDGVTVLLNDRNVGFGPACNQGVLHARAPFVCLLNSDAFVEPGWLEPLIRALEEDPGAGAAVPCLLHLDGTLQEAGGLVGGDGSTRALGDGASADALEYRFRRCVDYGSAACLVMRRKVFSRIGGFDPAYPLGYCEDVDLCFALSELGLRTVYEPRSRVLHVRWGSSSRDQAERRVFANQPILLARWRERLAGRPSFAVPSPDPHDILQGRDAEAFDRLLFVAETAARNVVPPPRLRALAAGVARMWPASRVTLLTGPVEGGAAGAPTPAPGWVVDLLADGVEVVTEADWDAWLETRRFHYSAAVLSGPACFEANDAVISATQPQAVRVYDTGTLAYRSAEFLGPWWPPVAMGTDRGAQTLSPALLASRLQSLEAWGIESADVVLCGSPAALGFARGVADHTPTFLVAGLTGSGAATPVPPVSYADRRGFRAAGHLPAWMASGSPPEGPGIGTYGPLRRIAAALADRSPELGQDLAGAAVEAAPGRPPRRAQPARVYLLAAPYVGGIGGCIAEGIPFVAWRGGIDGFDLEDLEPLLVADDLDGFVRKAWVLHEDPELWGFVASRLSGLQGQSGDASGWRSTLWAALAHCGLGAPTPQPALA